MHTIELFLRSIVKVLSFLSRRWVLGQEDGQYTKSRRKTGILILKFLLKKKNLKSTVFSGLWSYWCSTQYDQQYSFLCLSVTYWRYKWTCCKVYGIQCVEKFCINSKTWCNFNCALEIVSLKIYNQSQ